MEIPVDVIVKSVTVFPDRARVTCLGRCEVVIGAHRIVAGDLPLDLDPASMRATGMGTARVRIRGLDVVRRHYVEAPSVAVQELEKKIADQESQLLALTDQQAVKQASIDHLNGLRGATTEYAWGLARGRSTTEQQATLVRFFEDEETNLRSSLRELAVAERLLRDEIEKLRRELDELQSARPRQRYEARLEVDVLEAGSFEPEVSYVVSRAGWEPLYDVRLLDVADSEKPQVEIDNLAEIIQNTGQDWQAAQLFLSTARPALNQRVPELRPWYIDVPRVHPRQPKSVAMAAMRENTLDSAVQEAPLVMAAMADVAPQAAEIDVAVTQESGTTVTFRVSGDVDIPGDGTPYKTTVGQYNLVPQIDYLTIPRHTDAAYRRAKFVNSTPAPFLPGRINLFVGEEYIGGNRLPYTPPLAELELVLGVEERIKVKRELKRRDVDKRMLRDARQVAFAYEIEVENLLPNDAKITVKDQYPVSRHEQIKVRLDRVVPAPKEETELHILEWQLIVSPRQKEKISLEYQIEHPSSLQIAGLVD